MTTAETAQLHVLLVEDHPVLREVMLEFIEKLPHVATCSLSTSAEEALEELEKSAPDLMLIDLSLPGMDGIELIRELRKIRPQLPCAILSGHRSQVYVSKAFAAGANAYLLKGDPVEIERGINMILAGNRYLSDELRAQY